MPNRRKDTCLPPFVYERLGKRVYAIWRQLPNGKQAWRLECAVSDLKAVAETRAEAVRRALTDSSSHAVSGETEGVLRDWLSWQLSLSGSDLRRRAASTLTNDESMIDALSRTLGHLPLELLSKAVSYDYLDACARSGRAERGNKEIALARTIFEWAVATRRVPSNPFDGVRKLKTIRRKRYVTDQEIDLVQEVSKEMGAQYRIVALALKAAYLCVRRSVEVRSLTREMIQADGVRWQDGKQSRSSQKPDVLIEWSPELRAVIDEALNTPRGKLAGVWFVFGNSRGQRYTKGGWKAMLGRLMARASEEAKRKDIPFTPFSLQDCRPKAVSDKLNAGHQDVQDATNHSSGAMVRKHYDVRPLRVAKPVK